MMAPDDRAAFLSLAQNSENVLHSLYREVEFWTTQILDPRICNVYERISNDPASINQCSPTLISIVDSIRARGETPRVLDLGSGPFSLMYYFKRTGKAEPVAVDILAREYCDMLTRFKFCDVVMPRFGTGEFLDVQLGGEQFDIVYIGNALDHTSSPALSWLNAVKLTKVNGIIGHGHFVREGSAQKQDQLHQFDLYPVDDQLWIDDLKGHCFSLTKGLPLRLLDSQTYLVNETMPAFNQLYVKTGDEPETAEFLGHVVEDLRRAFQRRTRWAFQLEQFVNLRAGLGSPQIPYTMDPDKA